MRRINNHPLVKWALVPLAMGGAACSADGGESNPGGSGSGSSVTTGNDVSTSVGDGDGDGEGPAPAVPGVIPGGVKLSGKPEYHAFVRLTHEQWENSVRDLLELGEAPGVSGTFYPDPPEGLFANNEHALYVSGDLWSDYQRGAETVAERVATNAAVMNRLGGLTNRGALIEKLGHRAFRRALTAQEKTAYEAAWDLGATYYASGNDEVDGVRVFLEALLQSPNFVYRMELTAPGTRLSGSELATKLSLLLRNTIPSDELLASAEAGELDTEAGLLSVAGAMLDEPGALETVTHFHSELYGLDRYKSIEKSTATFPFYNEQMNQTLLDADLMFFKSIYESDGGFREIMTSNTAFTNRDTARYYGLSSTNQELTEVTLDGSRPGFLTRLGFLAKNAALSDPDPIHRGVDINIRMLCKDDLSPPAGTIPPLPEPLPGQSNRELVEHHTSDVICAQCHETIINPLGFAFENFDGMGQERTMDAGKPVNTAATYEFNDGMQSFTGANELIAIMAEHQQAHGCYSAKLAQYVLARDVAGREAEQISAMQQASFTGDASTKELVLSMIKSPLFTTAQSGVTQ